MSARLGLYLVDGLESVRVKAREQCRRAAGGEAVLWDWGGGVQRMGRLQP